MSAVTLNVEGQIRASPCVMCKEVWFSRRDGWKGLRNGFYEKRKLMSEEQRKR